MLFDTDVLIWVQRGNPIAETLFENTPERYISIQTYMELLQCALSKQHLKITKDFLKLFDVLVLPLTENIGHRAVVYIEEYGLSTGIRAGDAIIAATAIENDMMLATTNYKHFKAIHPLSLKVLKV